MSEEVRNLLGRMRREPQTAIVRRLRTLLSSPLARIVANGADAAPVPELERTWAARQKIAHSKKRRLFGVAGLLQALRASDADRKLRIVAAIDERDSATMFFDAATEEFLGAVVMAMSEHTRMYYAGKLVGSPVEALASLPKSA